MSKAARTVTQARDIVKLRQAAKLCDSGCVKQLVDEVIEDLMSQIERRVSKHQAAQIIGVSVPTLSKWVNERNLLNIRISRSGRPRISVAQVIDVADCAEDYRRLGLSNNILPLIVDGMLQRDANYRKQYAREYVPWIAQIKDEHPSARAALECVKDLAA